jgi:nucleosome binding factor SPN SPT16 subunit
LFPTPFLRYYTPRNETVDVMYRNIRHAFFQPAEKEMITILHFHLHNPIMIGNKKTKDVQFYVEVGGRTAALGCCCVARRVAVV